MGKRAMYKTVKQKYDIWLGEIKCNVKCFWQLSTFDIANRHLFRMDMGVSGLKFSFSVLLCCCAILLFCYDVLSFVLTCYCSVIRT